MDNMAVKLSTPWVEFYRKIDAFFKYDPEVSVLYDNTETKINIYVESAPKAEALQLLIPTEKVFGNITLTINVIPANGVKLKNTEAEVIISEAFKNNPALSYTRSVRPVYGGVFTFIVFKNIVVQYFNDNFGDINGLRSTLYEDLAREVFNKMDMVFYNTDVPASVSTPITPSLGKPLYK
jgi:hypothetical protein